jgi:putative aminopeptidase FrvX
MKDLESGGQMAQLEVDVDAIVEFLVELLNIPSPTGFTDRAIAWVQDQFRAFPLTLHRTVKGALVATWDGVAADEPRALTAHVDTLGAMVAEIKERGRLKLTQIGGYAWNSVEGEGVTVYTADGHRFRGTILPTKASVHAYGKEVADQERKAENMEVRLDVRAADAQEVRALGIEVGDFVALDPRVEVTETGFVRSRHLDDKASVACIFGALKTLADAGLEPAQRTTVLISNYEEHGHGAATGFPPDLVELLTVDMGVLGEEQNSDEYTVSICAKDSGGPYHLAMRRKLVALAEAAGIGFKVDVYPHYGSDGEAFWRAGGDVRVALVGPGVDASHAYERTHRDSLEQTVRLLMTYLLN